MRRDESQVTIRMLNCKIDGYKCKGKPKKRWMDCVKDDMIIYGVTEDVCQNTPLWKENTCCAQIVERR